MNINTSEYANTEQTEAGVGTAKFPDCAFKRERFLSPSEVERIICAYHKISDSPEQGRDRSDGERS